MRLRIRDGVARRYLVLERCGGTSPLRKVIAPPGTDHICLDSLPKDSSTPLPAQAREPLGRDYGKLLTASALGNLSDGIALVALPWYASTLTDDPLAVSAVGMATRLP